ncbi:hypothetical protein AMECASPLE_019694, partial [Ameca splendens]
RTQREAMYGRGEYAGSLQNGLGQDTDPSCCKATASPCSLYYQHYIKMHFIQRRPYTGPDHIIPGLADHLVCTKSLANSSFAITSLVLTYCIMSVRLCYLWCFSCNQQKRE